MVIIHHLCNQLELSTTVLVSTSIYAKAQKKEKEVKTMYRRDERKISNLSKPSKEIS